LSRADASWTAGQIRKTRRSAALPNQIKLKASLSFADGPVRRHRAAWPRLLKPAGPCRPGRLGNAFPVRCLSVAQEVAPPVREALAILRLGSRQDSVRVVRGAKAEMLGQPCDEVVVARTMFIVLIVVIVFVFVEIVVAAVMIDREPHVGPEELEQLWQVARDDVLAALVAEHDDRQSRKVGPVINAPKGVEGA